MSNLIDRQAAIDALTKHAKWMQERYHETCSLPGMINAIEELPSAQPEIIHCGDCKYKDDGIDEDGIPFLKCLNGRSYGGTRINDYCSWAERREE
jgi:hypothetical protein